MLLKDFISEKAKGLYIDIAGSKNTSQTSEDEEPKHQHTKKHGYSGVPEA